MSGTLDGSGTCVSPAQFSHSGVSLGTRTDGATPGNTLSNKHGDSIHGDQCKPHLEPEAKQEGYSTCGTETLDFDIPDPSGEDEASLPGPSALGTPGIHKTSVAAFTEPTGARPGAKGPTVPDIPAGVPDTWIPNSSPDHGSPHGGWRPTSAQRQSETCAAPYPIYADRESK